MAGSMPPGARCGAGGRRHGGDGEGCGRGSKPPGARCVAGKDEALVAAMVATGMDMAGSMPPGARCGAGGRRRGGDGEGCGRGSMPPGARCDAGGRRHGGDLAIFAATFFTFMPSSRIIDYVLRLLVVLGRVADYSVHESGVPKALPLELDTFVYSVRYCSFE